MKYTLDKEQTEYVLRDSNIECHDFVDKLSDENRDRFLSLYASLLLAEVEETYKDVLEQAKYAVQEFYGYQELYDKNYVYLSGSASDEINQAIEDSGLGDIEYDEFEKYFEWNEDELMAYLVDSDWTHCNFDYGCAFVEGNSVFFDRERSKDERVEKEIAEQAIDIYSEDKKETSSEVVEESVKDVREVQIKIDDGLDYKIISVKLDWDGRNDPVLRRACCDGDFYSAHQWTRKDGLIDTYNECLVEAMVNGLNSQFINEKSKAQELISNMPRNLQDVTNKPKLRQTV